MADTRHSTNFSSDKLLGLRYENSKIRGKPLINPLQTTKTLGSILNKYLRNTKIICPILAWFWSERSRCYFSTFLLTLTNRPEYFEKRARIDGKRGVEIDVGDTGLACRSCGDPLVTAAEDVGCGERTGRVDFGYGTTGFTAGVTGCSRKELRINALCKVWEGGADES
jgi:hypothetical protein